MMPECGFTTKTTHRRTCFVALSDFQLTALSEKVEKVLLLLLLFTKSFIKEFNEYSFHAKLSVCE